MKYPTITRWTILLTLGLLPTTGLAAEQDEPVDQVRQSAEAPDESAQAPDESAQAPDESAEATDEKAAASGLSWLSGLAEGHRRALVDRKPVLIRVGAGWCPICRQQLDQVNAPEVQRELARWTPVYVDVDLAPDDAEQLDVTAVPAWRIRTPGGQSVATRDGYLSAADLVAWLSEHYEAACAAPAGVLLDSGKPDDGDLVQLVGQFSERNPALREAAIRRLLPYPDVARAPVVQAFREGNLASRLAALELLGEWRAPIEGIDPWHPETITDPSMAALEKWCDQQLDNLPESPQELSQEQLTSAQEQIERMLKSTDAECEAVRERLARLGTALLPEVYARLQQASTDRDRERLLALRYRLVAGDALVLRWPGGLVRLAATDSQARQEAAGELASLAGADDERLLLELFSDPDPLVREISLRGLQHIGGKEATSALVQLLADPEPNVRAAVLKQLEEAPQPTMVPKIAEYLKTETDPDLIVHAIRFLRSSGGRDAVRSLISLLEHESWQVRAESAAALGDSQITSRRTLSSSGEVYMEDDRATLLRADICAALLKLLEDPDAFVVSRAVGGLADVDMAAAVDPLVKAATQHPNLASQIVRILADGGEMRPKALPHLRQFCKHEEPAIRAAAIAGVCRAAPDDAEKEVAAGLNDGQSTVRAAAASALFDLLENSRRQGAASLESQATGPTSPFANPFAGPGSVTYVPGIVDVQVHVDEDVGLFGRMIRSIKRHLPSSTGDEEGDEALKTQEPVIIEVEEEALELPGRLPRVEAAQPVEEAQEAEAYAEPEEEPSPESEPDAKEPPDGEPSDVPEENRWDKWLEGFCAGEGRPEWMGPMVGPLETMLQAEDAEERIAAAQTLVPMGKVDLALPVLRETARSHPELLARAAQVLPWLCWEKRLDTFDQLRPLARDEGHFAALVYAMVEVPDRRAAGRFWELLADEPELGRLVASVHHGLLKSYLGNRYYSPTQADPSARRALVDDATKQATAGNELQRLTALSLLAGTAPDEAVQLAAQLADDPQLSEALRRDAFQVVLATQPESDAVRTAIDALGQNDADRQKLALVRLVQGPQQLTQLRETIYMNLRLTSASMYSFLGGSEPIVPEAPPGLEARHVRPLLDDPDPQSAAYAGYLLALLGEKEGLAPLLGYWRHQDKNVNTSRLVYRAITALDDSTQIAVLEEIYGQEELSEYQMRDFYWTIRSMSGPEILRLRKKFREEVGMLKLR